MLTYFKNFILFGILIISLSSCNKEGILASKNDFQTSNDLTSLVSQVKEWHDSSVNSKITSKSENFIKSQSAKPDDIIPPVIDWNLAFKNYDSLNVKSITIPIDYNITSGELLQLVATSRKDSINGFFIKQIPDSAYYATHPDVINLNGFTGKYIIYDLFGHCLLKLNFKSGTITSNSSNNNQKNIIKSNGVSTPCSTCDLPTVTVTSYSNFLDDFNNVGAFAIASNNGLYYDPVVIAGGGTVYNSSLLNFISIPNGECVFGSLSYMANLFGFNLDADHFIQQWAETKKMSLTEMKYKLDNVQIFRPGFKEAVDLLNKNFITTPLRSNDAVLNSVKNGRPVFVLLDWNDGKNNGHCVVLRWDNDNSSLFYYDSIDDSRHTIQVGDEYYSKIKYFYEVKDINYEGF